jgi:hypothetical protein
MEKEEFDKLWCQYEHNTNLYKFYFDLFIKIHLFYYGITGGIIAFYFTHKSIELIKYSLLLPILVSLALIILFWIGAGMIKVIGEEILLLTEKLDLQTYPDTSMLSLGFRLSSIFYGVVISFMTCLLFIKI